MEYAILLFGAGLLAGAMNAAAGGGSFVTLSALVAVGVPSLSANASSTVALFPGNFASTLAYRHDLRALEGLSMGLLVCVSVLGGITGAVLLLRTPQATFDRVVPWLMLIGALAFAFGPQVSVVLRRVFQIRPSFLLVGQFALGIYGGYFGGAVGIMMLAFWSLIGLTDLKAMNAAKTLMVGASNTIAAICFIVADKVWWPQAMTILVAGVVGGYSGGRLTRRLPARQLRIGITAFNFALTAAFFIRSALSPR
jgi:uncharacterized membrane protein YfcA